MISPPRIQLSVRLGVVAFSLCSLWASTSNAANRAVAVPEAIVHSAPFEVAPEIARVHAGDVLPADDQAQGVWRRVQLPDGRFGFIHDAEAQESVAAPPPAVPPPAPSPTDPAAAAAPPIATAPTAAAPPTVTARAAVSRPPAEPAKLGVMFSLLPTGTLSGTASTDTVFAMAVAPFIDVGINPYVAVGLSPQVIFRVKGDGFTGESAKEFDLRARVTARAPVSPGVAAFARLSPGYSIIALPSTSSGASAEPNPKGMMVDFSVGTEVALVPRLFLTVDLGYQVGFQSNSDGDLHTRYLHIGAGLAIGL